MLGGRGCTDFVTTCKLEDLTFRHNTIDGIDKDLICFTSAGEVNLDYRDNLINNGNANGIYGCDAGHKIGGGGIAQLNTDWGATWTWTYNRIAMGNTTDAALMPQAPTYVGNAYPTSSSTFWTNPAAGDYTLAVGSPAKNAASDGTDQGVDFSAYNAAR